MFDPYPGSHYRNILMLRPGRCSGLQLDIMLGRQVQILQVCFYNGGSSGLRRCLASIVTRRIRFPRPPPSLWSRHIVVIIPACLVGYRGSIPRGIAKLWIVVFMVTSWFAKPVYCASGNSSILLLSTKFISM